LQKVENREVTDYTSDWVSQVYRTRYKEQIYKGGKVKERTPGYCDRILFCSLPDAAARLVPERKTLLYDLVTSSGEGAFANEADNYCAVNDGPGMYYCYVVSWLVKRVCRFCLCSFGDSPPPVNYSS